MRDIIYYNNLNLNLPPINVKLAKEGDKLKIYDSLRHKYVALTPEEYVRQHFVAWLIHGLGYPPSLMANEVGIEVNDTKKRCDTVIYNPDGSPLIIVEYKAPEVEINQHTFDQIVRYNMSLKAKYLVVSNGDRHYCCLIDYNNNSYQFIPGVPDYGKLQFTGREN